jgi:teichuronic acid biosynthesis glycosyltransferase TuaC
MSDLESGPHIVVLSTLFPNHNQPMAGLFVRERMFRVGRVLPLTVVAPVPWFPLQSLLRRIRPGFRPDAPGTEVQQGVTVFHPRFFSVPGAFKFLDGFWMALGCLPLFRRLKRQGRMDIIDAHFAYPDGYAAGLLGHWLSVPVTVTMRGTESRHAKDAVLKSFVHAALRRADRVFAVSDSLRKVALSCGIAPDRVQVVGNGVDISRFFPQSRDASRAALDVPQQAKVMITVGGLVERKGFHRVIATLPELRRTYPDLVYLVVGGPSPEGDWTARLKALVSELGLEGVVRFLGPTPVDRLGAILSAADLFVLSTRNEGWANVLLEAMACGLPVVATDVGGNQEVVCGPELGAIVPFDDHSALLSAISAALEKDWDRSAIRAYAENNTWDSRVAILAQEFRRLGHEGRR